MYGALSDERTGLSFVRVILSSISHIYALCIVVSVVTVDIVFSFTCIYVRMYKACVSPGFAEQMMPTLRILCYNGSVVT
jgi:hypothetical protein